MDPSSKVQIKCARKWTCVKYKGFKLKGVPLALLNSVLFVNYKKMQLPMQLQKMHNISSFKMPSI